MRKGCVSCRLVGTAPRLKKEIDKKRARTKKGEERMWRCEDVRMWRCEDKKMWRCEDVKMWCEDKRMWRWEDVKMCWKWKDVKIRRCDVKMRGCQDEKMWACDLKRVLQDPQWSLINIVYDTTAIRCHSGTESSAEIQKPQFNSINQLVWHPISQKMI